MLSHPMRMTGSATSAHRLGRLMPRCGGTAAEAMGKPWEKNGSLMGKNDEKPMKNLMENMEKPWRNIEKPDFFC